MNRMEAIRVYWMYQVWVGVLRGVALGPRELLAPTRLVDNPIASELLEALNERRN